jgi:hypothetical protein
MHREGRMTVEEQNTFLAREYAEANRYMDNAKECLRKAKKDDTVYMDKKYVRMACGTAYNGVLIALDAWLVMKGVQEPTKEQVRNANGKKKKKPSSKPRYSIDYYKYHVAQLDGKMSATLHSVYNVLHLAGYYDGIRDVETITAGFNGAYRILDKIKPYTQYEGA